MKKTEQLGYFASGTAVFIWGLSFYFTKTALKELDGRIFDLLTYRFVISAAVMLLMWAAGLIKPDFKGKNIKMLLMMSLMQPGIYFIFETLGIKMVTTSEAGLMLAMFPIVTTVFGVMFLKERVLPKQWILILFSVSGIILINIFGYEPGNSSNLGRIILLCAVLIGSAFNMVSRKISNEFTPTERTLAMMVMGAVIFSSFAVVTHLKDGTLPQLWTALMSIKMVLPVIYLSLGCSLLAFFLVSYSATHLELSKSAIIGNLNTVVAIFASILILKEPFLWYHILGSVIVISGIVGAAIIAQSQLSSTKSAS
jgi:drug/metabolite transporter (DMT)-like permease